MTSEQQMRANRRNAQLSTGPTTQAGKAAARTNALRRGRLSRDIVIAGEDPDQVRLKFGSRLHAIGSVGVSGIWDELDTDATSPSVMVGEGRP